MTDHARDPGASAFTAPAPSDDQLEPESTSAWVGSLANPGRIRV